ncbi:MAG: PilZ domain-containing protein [Sedimentisphaerales bacterium]|nr:PilZ domain-containing protein [Sedimentisphaerales bacterium]
MLGLEQRIFFGLPVNSEDRVLFPAEIIGNIGDNFTAEFCNSEFKDTNEDKLDIQEGQEMFIYYEMRNEFMQQSIKVDSILKDDPQPIVDFKVMGKPVSAERRQAYRVSTLVAGLGAIFGEETNCPLVDVSVTGYSLISTKKYELGNIVETTLSYDGQEYCGSGSVQSIRELTKGRYRYGLHGLEDKTSKNNLQRGLEKINMGVQLEQLRRMSPAHA